MKNTSNGAASRNPKAGLQALLTPDNCALILIDHQPFQFAGLRSHDSQTIVNNVVGLAKTAKNFGVPTLLTTVTEARGGCLLKPLQDVFPEQKPIERTFINTWEDERVVAWVEKTGRKKIVMAGLWTEICLAMPTIQAIGEGYEARVFNERDAARRLAAVRELYAEDAKLYEPQTEVTGHEAISGAVGELLATLPPDMMFTPTGAEGSHHRLAFARWQGGVAGGPAVVTGMDVANFEAGRITALYVFLDAPAQEEPS